MPDAAHDAPLSAKLELVLKALNMSRGRLAADLGVDKSLVGRWVSGAYIPSGHNLARLTALIAGRRTGFTLADWDRSLADLAAVFGVDPIVTRPTAARGADDPATIRFASAATARRETERRGEAYEGFWRALQPAVTQQGTLLASQAFIRRQDGLLRICWGGAGWRCSGWLMPVMGQLYGMMADDADDSILFCILNGVSMPRVEAMDGLILVNAKDVTNTPTAGACLLQRIGDLTGDPAADEARYESLRAAAGVAEDVPDDIRAHLFRDIGPEVARGGGDMLLRAPLLRSMSKGAPGGGWS
ncbi:transcriptional regulator with XRE-family HTH domain [Caulobacter ginsengisoli]|uniref:Transcriptional regulator with XRE-family HTH domain n=1 Tax=Caulobacter ginsengisoli TaxID=400775 RepID=A0ABU0IYW2_9CAUL|nr:helix-turn-helix transcriptional regulator [Caulobacter ginsengisoli]MDQ0466363.1 transcriptional regulator with XRE-family HTH domain [Caulobacter ginsengisoli]